VFCVAKKKDIGSLVIGVVVTHWWYNFCNIYEWNICIYLYWLGSVLSRHILTILLWLMQP